MRLFKNKYLYMSLLGFAGLMASCSDDDDYTAGEPTPADCPALTFGAANTLSEELDPSAPTATTIKVYRGNTSGDATYAINVLSNADGIFSVPQTVSFASGSAESEVTVTFDGAEVGKSYTLEIGLNDADVDAYGSNTYTSFVYTFVRVKWNTLGTGQWLDGFWYGGYWTETEIQERDDVPGTYRIKNPYTDELVSSYGESKGTYTDYLVFTLSKGFVSWTTPIYINTLYEDSGVNIKGYFPSTLSKSLADSDELSVATTDDAGNILYFTITPYWYVDGVGGWGTDYPCYLAFPGVDLATEFGWNE